MVCELFHITNLQQLPFRNDKQIKRFVQYICKQLHKVMRMPNLKRSVISYDIMFLKKIENYL